MTLSSGSRIGSYEILSPLGAGGMGEVWRARDTKLGREVALKVLPEALAHDAERMARFQREAQVLASLNHPHIAAIYGLEESGGARALVMELVEGQTLAERIRAEGGATRRVAPAEEVLPIAKQIAEALEYAHERGIIHRDLKPANVKITPEGAVKVLDFGLAKALDVGAGLAPTSSGDATRPPQGAALQDSPTLTAAATQAGVILGTAAYMSPEQARGKAVDRRADIWAFGCVLFEMLTGTRPFEGETVTDVLAAVVRAEPDWKALPADTPPRLRELMRRCLIKDPKQRLRDIGEARIAIEETTSGDVPRPWGAGETPVLPEPPPHHRALPWALAGLLVGALIAGLVVWKFAAPAPQSAMHFSAVTNFAGVQAQPALSPDGRSVAFVSNRGGNYDIYVGLVRGGNLIQITHDPNLEARPSWSPDGTTLAYARLNHSGVWDIWEIPALGGTPHRVILNARDPIWSPDGRSLAYENTADGTLAVSGASGENPRQALPSPGPAWQENYPRFSPDGGRLAFIIETHGPYGELGVVNLASGKAQQLTHDGALALSPAWSPDGKFIYFASSRGGTMNIWKIAAAGGDLQQITSGQGDDAELDLSSDGKRLVFSTWRVDINISQMELGAQPGKQSVKLLTTDPARNQVGPVYSPDGKRLAYFSNLKGIENEGIWMANADGSNPVQLVQDSRINVFPQWNPDNQTLAYLSRSSPGDAGEYRSVPVSGGGPTTLLKVAANLNFDVGPAGRLLFQSSVGQVITSDAQTHKTEVLSTLPAGEKVKLLRWSPDGHSIAFIVGVSKEDDPNAGLWVDDFKSPPRQLFRGWVVWCARGPEKKIYFLEGKPDVKGKLWKVDWNGQGLTQMPVMLDLVHSYWVDPVENSQDQFDVSPDGRHLAFTMQEVLQSNIGMIENVR